MYMYYKSEVFGGKAETNFHHRFHNFNQNSSIFTFIKF